MRGRGTKTRLPVRPDEGRVLAGVCAGLSRALGLDVTLVRLAVMLLTLAWGIGLVFYLLLWVVMPEERSSGMRRPLYRRGFGLGTRSIGNDLSRSASRFSESWRRTAQHPWPRPLGRHWLAILLIACGLIVFLASLGAFQWLTGARALGLAVMALGVAVFATMRSK